MLGLTYDAKPLSTEALLRLVHTHGRPGVVTSLDRYVEVGRRRLWAVVRVGGIERVGLVVVTWHWSVALVAYTVWLRGEPGYGLPVDRGRWWWTPTSMHIAGALRPPSRPQVGARP